MKLKLQLAFIILTTVTGCSSAPINRRVPASDEIPHCPSECSPGQVCMNSFTRAGARCSQAPAEAPNLDFVLPFDSQTVAVCTHSSGTGSHSSSNAFYALDLATNYSKPPATVRASADGVAYVFGADPSGAPCSSDSNVVCQLCPEPQGTPASAQASSCGQAWGNHIRILHSNGYVSFYVHLDHPLVKTGTVVHKGDAIGVEGWTGAAGHRHIHWSIQAPIGSASADWINHISWAGQSVPFQFTASQNGKDQVFHSAKIICAHEPIGQAPAVEQPRFSGE